MPNYLNITYFVLIQTIELATEKPQSYLDTAPNHSL